MHRKPTHEIDLDAEAFRDLGYQLVDMIAGFFEQIHQYPTTCALTAEEIRAGLPGDTFPEDGVDVSTLMTVTAEMLFSGVRHTGHPKTLGSFAGSAAPVGVLSDLLGAALNANLVGWDASPVPCEIEAQTIRWLGQLVHYTDSAEGLFVSGGTAANLTGFFCARCAAGVKESIRHVGMQACSEKFKVYASADTHTWIEKAADLSGLGTDAIQWIDVTASHKINIDLLNQQIIEDIHNGYKPLMIVGNAGTVKTGAVDPLKALSEIARQFQMWFHVDGAFGAPAATLPNKMSLFEGMDQADSLALDTHKWLYAPIEAGAVLVKDRKHLLNTFGFSPDYYHDRDPNSTDINNYFALGIQNTRGFKALKVWTIFRQLGLKGIRSLLAQNIEMANLFANILEKYSCFEIVTHNLCVVTFRFGIHCQNFDDLRFIDRLNEALLSEIKKSGSSHFSISIIDDKTCLKACFTNFRTQAGDLREIIADMVQTGEDLLRGNCSGG
ncbi:pyridoxal phosphate-dependent decarboxylase family protein [Rhodospirillum sp. A1_3_36]|uniref:pyridoxal phosphate-dependent decarboxylase family protein n=1 Tax=Rhodospirillum sp. A1_3_36 TaxID=3391666 RepID=UPI0039A5FE72